MQPSCESAAFATDLFSPAQRVLIEDAEGGCRYLPAFIDAARADDWFVALRDGVSWRQQRRPMYDRVVDVPRLTSGYPLDGSEALPSALAEASARVSAELGVAFTHVGLNYYRDGHDSVAPHNDKVSTLIAGQPIALVSLGNPRRMEIRAKAPPRGVVRIDLEPGSLLVMSYAMQSHYDHGIPKSKHAVGPRISLAFRVRPPQAE
jgi:alkylated DNA repair dioxygenase AlkB